jgi:hypothetical protein
MGDHSNETLQLQNLRDDEELEEEVESEEEEEEGSKEMLQLQNLRDDEECARALGGSHLDLDEASIPWVLNHVDCFVNQSRGNVSVETLFLCPFPVDDQDYEVWDKVGRAVSNLKTLKRLCIAGYDLDDDDEDLLILDWEIVARILRYVRQSITIDITDVLACDAEEAGLFARVIHGHPTITSFVGGGNFSHESLDALYSALVTLPALESVLLCAPPEDEITLAHPESLAELLRLPTLRSVDFSEFYFTPALCQATANALMEGTAITNLKFRDCSFSAEGCAAILAKGLSRNTSVSSIEVTQLINQALNGALTAALSSNSTLRDLVLLGRRGDDGPDLSPFLLALGKNTGIKTLTLGTFGSMDESLSTAMKDGLGMNETLENLELSERLCDENSAMWCRALSFLRTNKTLKSLAVNLDNDVTKLCVSTLRNHIVAMLQENASLESLSIGKHWTTTNQIKAEEYFFLITALQHNTTLKFLNLKGRRSLTLTDDEDKQMAALLKKNYALERLPRINLKNRASDVGAILRLNAAGRRYLVQDGSSVSKGVEVLSRVNNSINCVFLHLLENPRLCDRSAVEKVSADETADSGGGGKREQASAHRGRESRRRLE